MQSLRYLVVKVCLLFWLTATGFSASAAGDPLWQVQFGRMMHLSDLYTFSQHSTTMVQDKDGFYWLGTQHGLYRFDGNELRHYRAAAEQDSGLSADWITSLLSDQKGRLWIGTRYGGIKLFDPLTERFEQLTVLDDGKGDKLNIARIYQDEQGDIWVSAYGDGLLRWSASSGHLVPVAMPSTVDGISTAYITDLWRSEDDALWLAVGDAPLRSKANALGGLIRWSLHQQQGQGWHQGNSSLASNSLSSLLPQGHQLLLGGFDAGLWQLDTQSLEIAAWPVPSLLASAQITDLLQDNEGFFWISTYSHGLWRYQPALEQWSHFPALTESNNSLRSNSLHQLYLDQQNALWLVNPSGFTVFGDIARQVRNFPQGTAYPSLLPSANVLGISVSGLDNVWLANREAGVVHLNTISGQSRHYPLPEGELAPSLARAIHVAHDAIWVGTDRGLYRLDRASGDWHLHQVLPGRDHQLNVGVLHQDPQQRLWLGSRGKGVLLLDEEGVLQQHFAPDKTIALPFSSVTSLLYDELGQLWVGSPDSGLWRWSESSGRINYWQQGDSSQHGLLFNGIQMLYQENRQLWIRAGNHNHRWLGPEHDAGKAFQSYQPMEVDQHLIAANWYRLLYRQHWLPELQTSLSLNAFHGMQVDTWIGSWASYNGYLFRGGSQGLDIFRPDDLPAPGALPKARLTSFALFNQQQAPGEGVLPKSITRLESLTLKYAQDMFSIRFAVPNLIIAPQLEYRYRLQNFDRDWLHVVNQERLATYTRLPPGSYQFEVETRLAGGDWQAPIALSIQVLPPWWMTWWFRALVFAAIVLALWLWLHLKMRAERAMRRELQRQVTKRTLELKEKHDALEASNKDLMLLQQIGREITASLDLDQVLSRCHQMLSELIDVHVMVIGLYRPQLEQIEFVFWQENGQQLPNFSIDAKDSEVLASLCFNRGQEIQVSQRSDFYKYFSSMPQPLCGEPMQSVLYIPLMANQQAVGVFSVQSPSPNAYSASQLDLLRTLASTIAIAVVNADTFTRLQQTQQQLVTQEKMASLGGLVAGVAHEINTPLGICVTATSHLKAEFEQVYSAFAEKKLQQSQFKRFLQHLHDGLKILEVNTERAAALVQSFKQVSVDQSADGSRDIELSGYLQDVLLSLQPQLKTIACQFELNCPENIEWTTDAGALAQILTNLVMNSIRHAFAETAEPKISLTVSRQGQQLQLDYRDNGCGMGPDDLKRLFEPFYTTKRSLGGTGLGAHIVYNLVTVRFKGQIEVQSAPGQGLHYRLTLPFGT